MLTESNFQTASEPLQVRLFLFAPGKYFMAGIYIHIPFCKQACNYCNFYFSTSPGNREKFVHALLKEIELTRNYLEGEKVETLYLGGGTPSLLTGKQLNLILDEIEKYYSLEGLQEFTLEANPDDLTDEKVKELAALRKRGLNRLSIGIQSFFDEDLLYMNRAHNAGEALGAVKKAQDAGFENITIDLIYGTPTLPAKGWEKNLDTAFSLNVPHISCYALTVEPKTNLERQIRKGKAIPVDEEQSARQFVTLMKRMKKHGYEQYEISNFAKPGRYAIHNSNYWFGKKYLGLGPSAHSFNGVSRQWNVRNTINYMHGLSKNELAFEQEILTASQKVNEKIMTAIRTQWGLKIAECGMRNAELISKHLEAIDRSYYTLQGGVLKLTDEGKMFADAIAAELFAD